MNNTIIGYLPIHILTYLPPYIHRSGSERWIHVFRRVFALLSLEDVYNVQDGVIKLLKVYPQFSSAIVFSLEKAAVSLLKDKTVIIDEPTRPRRSDLQILLILYRLELNQGGRNNRSGWQWDRFVDIFSHNSDNKPIEDSETVDRKENSDVIVKIFFTVCECLVNLTLSDNEEDSAYKNASSPTTTTICSNRLQAIISIIVPSSDGADHFRCVCYCVCYYNCYRCPSLTTSITASITDHFYCLYY